MFFKDCVLITRFSLFIDYCALSRILLEPEVRACIPKRVAGNELNVECEVINLPEEIISSIIEKANDSCE